MLPPQRTAFQPNRGLQLCGDWCFRCRSSARKLLPVCKPNPARQSASLHQWPTAEFVMPAKHMWANHLEKVYSPKILSKFLAFYLSGIMTNYNFFFFKLAIAHTLEHLPGCLIECHSREVVQGLHSSSWTYTNTSEQGTESWHRREGSPWLVVLIT